MQAVPLIEIIQYFLLKSTNEMKKYKSNIQKTSRDNIVLSRRLSAFAINKKVY